MCLKAFIIKGEVDFRTKFKGNKLNEERLDVNWNIRTGIIFSRAARLV